VVKLYTKEEVELFLSEAERNMRLKSSQRVLTMTKAVGAYDEMPSLIIGDQILLAYNYIVVPYCKKGSLIIFLLRALKKKIQLSHELKMYLFKQCIMAVHELHTSSGMAHNDIKPDNYVIKDDGTLALIDFAHASWLADILKHRTGTDKYNGPEKSKSDLNYSAFEGDMWSLGVTLFITQMVKMPYQCLYDNKYYIKIHRRDIAGFYTAHEANEIPLELRQMVFDCLHPTGCRRPSTTILMQSQFVSSIPSVASPEVLAEIQSILN
jgi:serine/threonine protein kinase